MANWTTNSPMPSSRRSRSTRQCATRPTRSSAPGTCSTTCPDPSRRPISRTRPSTVSRRARRPGRCAQAGARDDPLAWNQSLLDIWKQTPHHYARLKRDLNHFWSLPREERDRLRSLDKELHDQDSATQNRLWNVLERYHDWLERLSESDR